MLKNKIIEKVKKSKMLYFLYAFFMKIFISFIKLFIKTDNKMILFVSYGGRYANDSPKCIYDMMINDERFKEYKLIWGLRSPNKYNQIKRKVKIDTIKYFIIALKSRCWVTNVIIERGLNFVGKNTYYFHTTHGVLPKISGLDANKKVFGHNFISHYDTSCAQGIEEIKYQMSMFGLPANKIKLYGYPKNDALVSNKIDKEFIKSKLGIPKNKKIILYAPTFREEDNHNMFYIDINLWEKTLKDKYVLLLRVHPILCSNLNLIDNNFVYDVSKYENNSELMFISDVLISDYSGIFFEYAVLNRPMFCYAYDYDLYQKSRGLYFDIRNEIQSFSKQEDLLKILSFEDYSINMQYVKSFRDKFVNVCGNSTELCVNDIYNNICEK